MNEELLAAHILRQAVKDLRGNSAALQRNAAAFWRSSWCDDLLTFLDLELDAMPAEVKTDKAEQFQTVVADARRILAELPEREVGEDEPFMMTSIDGRTALVFPDARAYWLEDDGTVGAVRLGDGSLVATTRFARGEEVDTPALGAN